jgi:hypothetical protein
VSSLLFSLLLLGLIDAPEYISRVVANDVTSMAYAEMRLILAKVLFNFDLELVDKSQEWMKGQKVLTLWMKPSLMVTLKPVQR